jgi:hypothetical protein
MSIVKKNPLPKYNLTDHGTMWYKAATNYHFQLLLIRSTVYGGIEPDPASPFASL